MPPESDTPTLGQRTSMKEPVILGPKLISSPLLSLISWWIGKHTNLATVRDLVVRSFKSDDMYVAWSKLREVVQQAADQVIQPPPKHRAETKLAEEIVKEVFEVDKAGSIVIVFPPSELGLVKSRMDSNPEDERPVSARLESLEDMMKNVVDKLGKIELSHHSRPQPSFQINTPPGPDSQPNVSTTQQSTYAQLAASGLNLVPNQVGQLLRGIASGQRRSSKRSLSGAIRDNHGNTKEVEDDVFTDVNRKRKKKEVSQGTATQTISGISQSLQPSYQHFIGNTPGSMEKDTMEKVLKELARPIFEEKGLEGTLEIEDCNCLTKEPNSRTRVWRVLVPDKHQEIMKDDRLYPTGWYHRTFEGNFRPSLTPEKIAEIEAKRAARINE